MVQVGDTGPDFTLEGTQGDAVREFTLSTVADGRPAALVFYIYDFSPVCTTQMCEVNDMELLTLNDDAAVLGISTDGPYSHQRFIAENGISYPLLTDDDRTVHRQYGMLEETDDGHAKPKRGVVLLDADRTVRYRWEAADNWDDWEMRPLVELNDHVNELVA